MIPGEMFIKDGDITLNAGRKTVTLTRRQFRRPADPGRLALPFLRDQPGAEIRPQNRARHAARHRGRHRGAFRAGADARGHAGRARRQAHDLRFSRRRDGEAVRAFCGPLKTITGRPSSARHKLSDPFPGARVRRYRRTQLLRARTGKHGPRIQQAAPMSMPAPVMAAIRVRREPKMADLTAKPIRVVALRQERIFAS